MFQVLLRLKATRLLSGSHWVSKNFPRSKSPKKTVNPVWFMVFFSIPDFFVSQPSVFLYVWWKQMTPTPHFSQHCMAFGVIVPSPSQWWLYAWPLSEIPAAIWRLLEERIHEDMTGRTTVIIWTRWKPSTGEDSFSLFFVAQRMKVQPIVAFQETTRLYESGWKLAERNLRSGVENWYFLFKQSCMICSSSSGSKSNENCNIGSFVKLLQAFATLEVSYSC